MITLSEAIKIAEQERGSKICEIKDCNDRWAFAFEEDKNSFDSIPAFVFKLDGRFEPFYISDYFDLLKLGTYIELADGQGI